MQKDRFHWFKGADTCLFPAYTQSHTPMTSVPLSQTTLCNIPSSYQSSSRCPSTVLSPSLYLLHVECWPQSLCVCVCLCDSGGARLAVWAGVCFQTVEYVTDTPGRAISGALMSSADHSAHQRCCRIDVDSYCYATLLLTKHTHNQHTNAVTPCRGFSSAYMHGAVHYFSISSINPHTHS